MTADELRRLAVLIERTDHDAIDRAAAYLRACADAQEKGPVAWTLQETLDKRETTHRAYLWFVDPQNSAWAALYPVAIPASLRLPEPMTDAEFLGHLSLNPPTPSLWQHLKADAVVADVQSSVLAIATVIEAETLRRVKEANK